MAKHRVLVVDDEILIRDLLYDFFTEKEFDISVAENARAALNQLEKKQFDCILLDFKMPDMDGIELAKTIKASGCQCPIVMITGYPSVESAVDALRMRLYDYVTKPFNINQLYHLVDRAATEFKELTGHSGRAAII